LKGAFILLPGVSKETSEKMVKLVAVAAALD